MRKTLAEWVDAEDVLAGKFRLMPPQVRNLIVT